MTAGAGTIAAGAVLRNVHSSAGLAEANDDRKKALLIHAGQRGTADFSDSRTRSEICGLCYTAHWTFAAPQNVMLRRIVFRQRRQQAGESVHHYVAYLRGLASLCKFGELEDELIRDQLAEHTNSSTLREKLLIMTDKLTLTRAVEVAFQLESAAALASQLAPSSSSFPHRPMLLTQTVALPMEPPGEVFPEDNFDVNFAARQGTAARRACGNCGSSSHQSRAPNCPAKGQRFQRCGRQKPFRTGLSLCSYNRQPTSTYAWAARTDDHQLSGRHLPTAKVLHGGAGWGLPPAAAGYGGLQVAPECFHGPASLSAPNTHRRRRGSVRYGHSKIGMSGTITFALGFTLVDNSGAAILSVGSPWHQRWPALFSGLGCLTAFDHEPLLKPEVHPVIQPICRLPLALRDDAAVSLEDLRLASEEDPTLSRLRITSGRDGLRSSRRSWRLFISSRTS
ncbi:hypothetical protein F7725_013482 [Dissostichus mawsoni]|uniref:Retrotransposon gag domain-containing protein n=1 Tax=Dissostichus mawsoni TaxID=36200 RepID=A0A7J5YQN5_DISMA|nr:hypothetical protein F7725_013482 [Dissostichus mawsoni]